MAPLQVPRVEARNGGLYGSIKVRPVVVTEVYYDFKKGGLCEVVETCGPSEAHFYAVYSASNDGTEEWLSDHITEQKAAQAVERYMLRQVS